MFHPYSFAGLESELQNMLSGIGSVTFTGPATLTKAKLTSTTRIAASFGEVRVRTPIKTLNVVTFTPPSLNYGCSGIDMTLGSFSVASREELISMLRSIASNALSYAFGQAIHAMCPPCWSGMESVREMVQNFNSNLQNSCEIAMNAVDSLKESTKILKCGLMQGQFSDSADCANKTSADGNSQQSTTDIKNNVIANGGDPDSTFSGGNLNAQIFKGLSVQDNTIDPALSSYIFGLTGMTSLEVVMNVLGGHVDANDQPKYIQPKIRSSEDLLPKDLDDATQLSTTYYKCVDLDGYTCGKLKDIKVPVSFKNMQTTVKESLDALFTQINSNAPIDSSQLTQASAFLANFLEPFIARSLVLSKRSFAKQVTETKDLIERYVVYSILYKFSQSVYQLGLQMSSYAKDELVSANEFMKPFNKNLTVLAGVVKEASDRKNSAYTKMQNNSIYIRANEEFSQSFIDSIATAASGKK
jgi:hypothetical protein